MTDKARLYRDGYRDGYHDRPTLAPQHPTWVSGYRDGVADVQHVGRIVGLDAYGTVVEL